MSWLFKDPVVIMKQIISWLFKDSIVTVLNSNSGSISTMPNQTAKNGLQAKKIKLPQMKFFLEKLIKLQCNYQPLSLRKI